MRVVVIGGLGNFGSRICKRLAVENGIEVIATGRHVPADQHVFDNGQMVFCARLDIDSTTLQADLRALVPKLVIHCAGPYQGQDYRVALAACAVNAHYLDLADGRDFVASFAANVDAAARAAGVLAVSGASSLPGLSSAVVDQLAKGLSRLDAIRIGIAPGQQAPRGVATIKAVFGYAGKPFARWNGGRWTTVRGAFTPARLRGRIPPLGFHLGAHRRGTSLALRRSHYVDKAADLVGGSSHLPSKDFKMPSLFDPLKIGALTLPNRILMAPLTRGRATREHVPTEMMIEYYSQRASAGLIISEATGITQEGLGWPYAPGIWSDEQVEKWKPVTEAVHKAGGRIDLQLWHMGRIVHPSFLGGAQPVSASATTAPGKAHTYEGKQAYAQARPLTLDDIKRLLDDYEHAARNAVAAGFNGVQIHAANGYLIDQFLRDNSNFREDAYGGSVENRVRLLSEVAQRVADTVGTEQTGVRLSPNGDSQGVNDSDPDTLFSAAGKALDTIGIAYLELREPPLDGTFGKADRPPVHPVIRKAFSRTLILNSDYSLEKGQAALAAGEADAITFGRPFLANPDLPQRFAKGLPLNKDVMETWYSQGPLGYIDYPFAND